MSKPQWNKVLRQRIEDITEWHLINEDGVMVAKVFPDGTWDVYQSSMDGVDVFMQTLPSWDIEYTKLEAVQAAFNAKLITTSPQAPPELQ